MIQIIFDANIRSLVIDVARRLVDEKKLCEMKNRLLQKKIPKLL